MTDANRPNAPEPQHSDSPYAEPQSEAQRAPAAESEALTPEQARLREALQRSRAIPLDGPLDADDPAAARPGVDDATTGPGGGATAASLDDASPDLQPRPGARRDDLGSAAGAHRAGDERETVAASESDAVFATGPDGDVEVRSEADYERMIAEDADARPTAAPATAATRTATRPAASRTGSAREADAEEVRKDADTFAPLGISTADGDLRRPAKRSNRGFALLVAVIATLVFATLYAGVFALARVIYAPGSVLLPTVVAFIGTAPFYVAVAIFFVTLLLWSVITNRSGWASFVVAGLVLGIATFLGYHLGVAVQQFVNTGSWDIAPMLASLRAPEHLPGALIAFIVAREVITWFGGIIALRGRKLTRENAADLADYERRRETDEALRAAANA